MRKTGGRKSRDTLPTILNKTYQDSFLFFLFRTLSIDKSNSKELPVFVLLVIVSYIKLMMQDSQGSLVYIVYDSPLEYRDAEIRKCGLAFRIFKKEKNSVELSSVQITIQGSTLHENSFKFFIFKLFYN